MERMLTSWAIVGDMSPLTAPELRRIFLSGIRDGTLIRTSSVVEKLGARRYRTRSGTIYKLIGNPDPAYIAFCAKNKIALDLADPIKLKGRTDG